MFWVGFLLSLAASTAQAGSPISFGLNPGKDKAVIEQEVRRCEKHLPPLVVARVRNPARNPGLERKLMKDGVLPALQLGAKEPSSAEIKSAQKAFLACSLKVLAPHVKLTKTAYEQAWRELHKAVRFAMFSVYEKELQFAVDAANAANPLIVAGQEKKFEARDADFMVQRVFALQLILRGTGDPVMLPCDGNFDGDCWYRYQERGALGDLSDIQEYRASGRKGSDPQAFYEELYRTGSFLAPILREKCGARPTAQCFDDNTAALKIQLKDAAYKLGVASDEAGHWSILIFRLAVRLDRLAGPGARGALTGNQGKGWASELFVEPMSVDYKPRIPLPGRNGSYNSDETRPDRRDHQRVGNRVRRTAPPKPKKKPQPKPPASPPPAAPATPAAPPTLPPESPDPEPTAPATETPDEVGTPDGSPTGKSPVATAPSEPAAPPAPPAPTEPEPKPESPSEPSNAPTKPACTADNYPAPEWSRQGALSRETRRILREARFFACSLADFPDFFAGRTLLQAAYDAAYVLRRGGKQIRVLEAETFLANLTTSFESIGMDPTTPGLDTLEPLIATLKEARATVGEIAAEKKDNPNATFETGDLLRLGLMGLKLQEGFCPWKTAVEGALPGALTAFPASVAKCQ